MTNLALRTVLSSLGIPQNTIDTILLKHRGTACSYLHESMSYALVTLGDYLPLESHLCVLREIQEHELKYMYPCIYIDRDWNGRSCKYVQYIS